MMGQPSSIEPRADDFLPSLHEAVVSLIPHGTPQSYQRHKCRCAACRDAEVTRQREWRRRHREGKVQHRPDSAVCVPVTVRGKLYPSISLAAADLGLTPATVSHQLRRYGTGDRAGLGHAAPKRIVLSNVRPCVIHGRKFPSIEAAIRYLGVGRTHLYRSLRKGVTPKYSEYLLAKLMEADARARKAVAG